MENLPLVKICGIKDAATARIAVSAGADLLGFVFYPPSPRHLSLQHAVELKKAIHRDNNLAAPPIVAVTVNADAARLEAIAHQLTPAWLQLHGDETPEDARAIRQTYGIPVIKAISVRSSEDIAAARCYDSAVDAILFDARAPEHSAALPGGNGLQFDWNLLKNIDFQLPWFLSGGLDAGNVRQAMAISGAQRVDVSSGVESSPGVKDPKRIRQFITAVKHGDTTKHHSPDTTA